MPTPEDRLFFLLTYLQTYALQVVPGRLFGMGPSQANQWLHVLLPALQMALRTLDDTPARSLPALTQRLGGTEAATATVLPLLPEASAPEPTSPLFAHDGTERRLVRPQDAAEQRNCDSGKQKEHPVKNILRVNAPLSILLLSETHGGRVHDKSMAASGYA